MGALRDWLLKLGADPKKVDALDGIEKAMPVTFAERMAQRELDDELPDAMSVLRSCIFWAFNPPPDQGDVDPKQVISDSLDQFKTWALALVDRANGEDVAKMIGDAEKAEAAVLKLAREGLAVRKSAGPKSDSATVNDVDVEEIIGDGGDQPSIEDRIGDLEETVAKLTPENIAKAMQKLSKETPPGDGGDAGGDDGDSGDGSGTGETGDGGSQAGKTEPVTKADLEKAAQKIVDDAAKKIQDIESKIEKLGEGGSSQSDDEIAKEESDRVAKAMEAEGFKPEDAKALGGIFN